MKNYFLTLILLPVIFLKEISGDDWNARFIQETPAAWSEYFQKGKDYRGVRIQTVTRIENGVTSIDPIREAEWRSNGTYSLYIEKEISDSKAKTILSSIVYCGNPNYLFKLTKSQVKAEYILDQIKLESRLGQDEMIGNPPVKVFKIQEIFFAGPIILANHNLATVIKDKKHNFKVTGPVGRGPDTIGFVRVPFQFEWQIPRVNVQFKIKGVLQLDPDNYWLLQRVDGDIERSGENTKPTKTTIEFFYKNLNNVPVLEKKAETNLVYGANGQVDQEIKTETSYKITTLTQPDPAEFYLTAFGIPEPVGFKAPRGALSWNWIVLCGFVLLIVAGALGWFLRKDKRDSIFPKNS